MLFTEDQIALRDEFVYDLAQLRTDGAHRGERRGR